MQNIFYAAVFLLARHLPARKDNLQLAIICASWIFSAGKLSYIWLINVIKIIKKYISFIDLNISINTWYIFQKWTTSILFSFMEETVKLVCVLNLLAH